MKAKTSLVAAAIALALSVAPTEARGVQTDANCMKLWRMQHISLTDPKADWIENYAGCDETYRKGQLVGFRKGSTRCEHLAYRFTFELGLSDAEKNRRMGGQCVLFEDWSWGAE